jgi:hypothetical protein
MSRGLTQGYRTSAMAEGHHTSYPEESHKAHKRQASWRIPNEFLSKS